MNRVPLSEADHRVSCEIQARLELNAPNYTSWIVRQASRHIGRRLLDIGCSTGNVTRHFTGCELLVGVDPNPYALDVGRAEWAGGRPEVQLLPITIPSDAFLALERFAFDSITCLNVLEHVQNDLEALRQMHQVLAPGGRLFLLVPANQWLYGSMDAADQHCRRYTRRGLAQTVAMAGFTVRSLRFMNAPGVAGWFINGRILRRTLIPSTQAGLFDRCVPFIERLEAAFAPPIGQSLVLVADR